MHKWVSVTGTLVETKDQARRVEAFEFAEQDRTDVSEKLIGRHGLWRSYSSTG